MAPAYNTIHIILHQLNEAFVERAFRRIAPSIIWTVLRSLSRVAPKRWRRCVSAGGRQETVRAGDPAPVTDPPNGEEWQAHNLGYHALLPTRIKKTT